jgi:hypothetical protein
VSIPLAAIQPWFLGFLTWVSVANPWGSAAAGIEGNNRDVVDVLEYVDEFLHLKPAVGYEDAPIEEGDEEPFCFTRAQRTQLVGIVHEFMVAFSHLELTHRQKHNISGSQKTTRVRIVLPQFPNGYTDDWSLWYFRRTLLPTPLGCWHAAPTSCRGMVAAPLLTA